MDNTTTHLQYVYTGDIAIYDRKNTDIRGNPISCWKADMEFECGSQYYVTSNHEAIIQPEVFDMVQREMAYRTKESGKKSGVHLFSGKIKCGQCGEWYGSKVWHSNDPKYRKAV